MKLFDVLRLRYASVLPTETKVHLATPTRSDNPLRTVLAEPADFGRKFVVSLIKLLEQDRCLYVGTYAVGTNGFDDVRQAFRYQLERLDSWAGLAGRLVVSFPRPVPRFLDPR